MARPRRSRAGCVVSLARSSRSSRSTARTSGAPSVGSRNRTCSCARVTVAPTTRTARAPPDRRTAACSNIPTRSKREISSSKPARSRRPGASLPSPRRSRRAPDRDRQRLARPAPAARHVDPGALTWCVGVLLLLMTLGMAFTGQVLRFDQDAYWGLGIGVSIASRVPVMGPWLVNLLLGGPIIAGATLSRFFALHVFVVPGLLIAFVVVHLILVLALGINEWPLPGRVVRRATYLEEYHRLTPGGDGIPFVPAAVWKDIFFSGFILLSIVACAAILGPFGPGGAPDPTIIQTAPRPDYFFLWLYAVLSLLPPSLETPALLIVPGIVLLVLLALPFVSGEGEKSWRRRPIAVLTILLLAVALGSFTHLSGHAPWSPAMDAWSGEPIPADYLKGRTALERQGALVFQVKQCHNCHALDEHGGQRGPTLDAVAVRLTHDQLIRQVIQGGGNMPAYGKNLSPAETTALVAFLETLHPAGQAPARDASQAVASSLRP